MKKRTIVLTILFVANVAVFFLVLFRPAESRLLTISFLDIGQGDGILITSPTGNHMIVDAGPTNSIITKLSQEISYTDRDIDIAMITNPDKDHIAGFVDIFKRYRVGRLIEAGTFNTSEVYREVKRQAGIHSVPTLRAERGTVIDLGGGVFFRILFPDRDVANLSTNDGSIVGVLEYGKVKVVFTGDAPAKIEKYLVSLHDPLDGDVLKAGHHGSKTSSSEEFLNAITPTHAVVSVGRGNTYHHPSPEVLDRFASHGITTSMTMDHGTIRLISDGERIWWRTDR